MLKLGIIGANGRMGKAIIKIALSQNNEYLVNAAIVKTIDSNCNFLKDNMIEYSTELNILKNVNVVIDFSSPKNTLNVINYCLINKIPIVIGTTGFSHQDYNEIVAASVKIPILYSSNMSISVTLLKAIIAQVTKKIPNYEVEIIEAHHKHKKDAPSGTALSLGQIIATAKNQDFNKIANFSRCNNQTIRNPDEIGFSVIRGGNIIGTHEVEFIDENEILSFKSTILDRSSFAKGALSAAKFIFDKPPALYSMEHVYTL